VVVWENENGVDGQASGIVGQRFDAAGLPDGTEFVVNTYTESEQKRPAVSATPTGEYVIVWDGYNANDVYTYGVSGRRYDNAGNPLGTQFDINQFTGSYQWNADVAVDDNGGFVVVWASDDYYGYGDFATFARRYEPTGGPDGTEFQVNTYNTEYQYYPSVDT